MAATLNILLATSFVILTFAIYDCDALKCFSCNSHNNAKCSDEKPPSDLIITCPLRAPGQADKPYSLCRKIVQSIEYEVNGLKPEVRIIRTCGWDNSSFVDKCYQRSGFGGRQEVCSCTTDSCNSSSAFTYSGLLILSIFGLLHLVH